MKARRIEGLVTLTRQGKTVCERVNTTLIKEPDTDIEGVWTYNWHIPSIHAPYVFSGAYSQDFNIEEPDEWFDVKFEDVKNNKVYKGKAFSTMFAWSDHLLGIQGASPLAES